MGGLLVLRLDEAFLGGVNFSNLWGGFLWQ
jgi:hypothetical protein